MSGIDLCKLSPTCDANTQSPQCLFTEKPYSDRQTMETRHLRCSNTRQLYNIFYREVSPGNSIHCREVGEQEGGGGNISFLTFQS